MAGLDAGEEALRNGDYATALREFRPLARQGNAVAQFLLGLMYDDGRGVPRDYAEAVRWYRMAAEQGNARAQFSLGSMYDHGEGLPRDHAEAIRWYRKAAEQGNADAQNSLGLGYEDGQGAPQDHAEPPAGTARQRNRETPARSSTSHSAMNRGKGCRRTT